MTIAGVPTDVLRSSDLTWESLANKPLVFPPSAHGHSAADITSGTLSDNRLSSLITRLNAANVGTLSADGMGTHRFGPPGSVSTVEMTAGVVRAYSAGGSWSQMSGLGLQSSGLLYLDAGASSGIMVRCNAANNNAVQFAADGSATFYGPTSWVGAHGNTTLNSLLPSQAAHAGKYLTSNGANTSWATVASGGGTWGSITGTLSAQTDLQPALDAKVPRITSLDEEIARYDGTTGAIQTSGGVTINDQGNLTFPFNAQIKFRNAVNAPTTILQLYNDDVYIDGMGGSGNDIIFRANGESARILGANNYFGIGTASPTAMLHVGGAVRFDGNVSIGANSLVGVYTGIYNDGKWLTGTDGYGAFSISPFNAAFAFAPPAAGAIVTTIDFAGRINTVTGLGVGSMNAAATTVRYFANSAMTKASIRADSGVEIRNLADSADANLSAAAGTFSGALGFSQARFQQPSAQTLQTQVYDTSLAAWQETAKQAASPSGALVSLWGGTPSLKPPAYNFTNVTTRRTLNCDASSVDELADALATLYNDIKCLMGV